jgi:hypothetical protein
MLAFIFTTLVLIAATQGKRLQLRSWLRRLIMRSFIDIAVDGTVADMSLYPTCSHLEQVGH